MKQRTFIKTFTLSLIITISLLALFVFSRHFITDSKREFNGTLLQTPVFVENVKLQHKGLGDVDISNWRGDILLMFFGFTRCPDVCPLTLGHLANIYRDLGEPEDLQVIMISIDPQNDTPEAVQNYISGFHPNFIGLSGSASNIASAAKGFFVGYKELPNQNQFIHTDSLAIVDKEGYMRLVYNQSSILDIAEDLKFILRQNSW